MKSLLRSVAGSLVLAQFLVTVIAIVSAIVIVTVDSYLDLQKRCTLGYLE